MVRTSRKRGRKWITQAIASRRKGALHRSLGVPQDERIPPSILRRAAARPGITGKRARLAITLSKLHHKRATR
jgi:hypothetical protein